MNGQKRPHYWQLDVLVLVLITFAVALMRAHLSPGWAIGAEIGWSLLALLGLVLWVCADWTGLRHDEQAQHGSRASRQGKTSAPRTPPLTPVQRRFLAATRAGKHADDTE